MRLASSDAWAEHAIFSELNCSERDLLPMRNQRLELQARQATGQRQIERRRDWFRWLFRWPRPGRRRAPADTRSGTLLVSVSPHLLRCSAALRNLEGLSNVPRLLFLQVTPLAEWVAAGVVLRPHDFSRRRHYALSRALPEERHALLREWFGVGGNPLWCRPDTLEWACGEDTNLFSPDVAYRYFDDLRSPEPPLFPVLRADSLEANAAILANPELSWRRTVYTNDAEVAKLLAACEHPDVRLLGIDTDCSAGKASDESFETETRAFFLNSFRNNAFAVEMTGPAERAALWNFAENCFGRIFGRESCFVTPDPSVDAIFVRLVSPAAPIALRWRIDQTASGPLMYDGAESFAGVPPYLRSRRAFVSWAFHLF